MTRILLAACVLVGCRTASLPDSNNAPQVIVPLIEASAEPVAAVDGASATPSIAEIVLSRSQCYGYCADYQVTIRGDGTVEYDGHAYVSKHGKAADKIPQADVEALVRTFDKAKFDTLSVPQKCPAGIATDGATNTLTLRRNGREHVVEHYTGNSCAPKELFDLASAVDQTAKTDRWTRCGKGPDGYCQKR